MRAPLMGSLTESRVGIPALLVMLIGLACFTSGFLLNRLSPAGATGSVAPSELSSAGNTERFLTQTIQLQNVITQGQQLLELQNAVSALQASVAELQGTATHEEPTEEPTTDTATTTEDCHPFNFRTAKMMATGYDGSYDSLNKKVSFTDSGHWLKADYDTWDDAAPFLFHAGDECHTYVLQNVWPGLEFTGGDDAGFVGYTSCGEWLRSTYSRADAVPFRFQADEYNGHNDTYKMQNMDPATGQWWLSYTTDLKYSCGDDYATGSLRTDYSEYSAGIFQLVWQ